LNSQILLIGGTKFIVSENSSFDKVESRSIDFATKTSPLEFNFTHALHASTPTNVFTGLHDETKSNFVALNSLNFLLDDAIQSKNKPNVVHLSSGAVYQNSHKYKSFGIQETAPTHKVAQEIDYTSTKLQLEEQIELATEEQIILGCNPRLFAFYGPFLPLDAHFAIGNFMKNGKEGAPIQVLGNPLTIRSYLYPVDLVVLLIRILIEPKLLTLNVGSNSPFSLAGVANSVSNVYSKRPVWFSGDYLEPSSYFPSITSAENLYGFSEQVSLEDGLMRWKYWLESEPRD
jgi:dTDP-glucose 4,6-dehydratase